MTGRFPRPAILAALLSLVFQALPAGPVHAATGPYTLPFFDPNNWITQGCHSGCAYDYSLNYEPVAATRAGTVHSIQSGWGVGQCSDYYLDKANWVFINHLDGQYTYYAHLSVVSVVPGQSISAGQRIGTSGESGKSCGAHLHYSLHNATSWWNSATSLVPNGRWTTDPGRVAYLAAYVREHSPAGYSVMQWSTWTTWVEFRNDGGRTWFWNNDANGKGRVYLDATNTAGSKSRVSSFYLSGDWETTSRPGGADVDGIAPGQTVRITFGLRAASAGSFNEYFNLGSLGITYFDYPYMGGFWIPVSVSPCC